MISFFKRMLPVMVAISASQALAQTLDPDLNTFTYQGTLNREGVPYTGTADFRFTLFSQPTLGGVRGGPDTVSGVEVSEGLFLAPVNLGSDYTFNRFIQVEVRTPAWDGTGTEPPFVLFPTRTPVTSVPRALSVRGLDISESGDITLLGARSIFGLGSLRGIVGLELAPDSFGPAAMIIDRMDRVGIGTLTPERRLDVFGDVRLDGTNGVFEIGSGSDDTMVVRAEMEVQQDITMGANAAIRFADGTELTSAYRPIVHTYTNPTFTVPNNSQNTLLVFNVTGAQPGMAVIVTPLDLDLFNFHAIAQARVTGPGRVEFRIISNGGGDRTYTPQRWRITVLP
jgi:hypothetical protein